MRSRLIVLSAAALSVTLFSPLPSGRCERRPVQRRRLSDRRRSFPLASACSRARGTYDLRKAAR